MSRQSAYLSVGKITKAQGLSGAVRAELTLDDDRHFKPNSRVTLAGAFGEKEAEIEFLRRQHGRSVLKFLGIDSIAEAEQLIGAELRIRTNDLLPPPEGSFYTFQLKGCRVYASGEYVGTVTDVLDYGGTEILKVDLDEQETLIPFAESYLRNIDLEGQRIDMELPEGLRDINK